MRNYLLAVVAAVSLASVPLLAQGGGIDQQCNKVPAGLPPGYNPTQDACQKAVDVFNYLAPQLGVIIAGGNATLGVGGTIGGLGHIYISGRANLVSSDIPRVDQVTPSVTGAHSDNYPTRTEFIGIPQADVSIGLFRGIPLGVTNVGGLDLLVSATYLPSFNAGGVKLQVPGSALHFGVGARLGIVQESIIVPGISVTYLRRGLPDVDLSANNGQDTLHVNGINVTTDSWRLVASKSFFGFGLAVGAGQDRYNSSATASAYVGPRAISGGLFTPGESTGPIALAQKLTRTTYFADGSFNLPFVRLIGEIGETASVNVPTYNTFAGSAPGASRVFGAVGLRFGL